MKLHGLHKDYHPAKAALSSRKIEKNMQNNNNNNNTGLMINKQKGNIVTFADVLAVPVPERTDSYNPIPYGDGINCLLEQVEKQLGLTPRAQAFGLSKDGAKIFAKFAYDVGDAKSNLAVGFRSSYDKTIAPKIGGGASVLVCDNLCFNADGFVVFRKNTTHAWRDYQELVKKHVGTLMNRFKATRAECAKLEEIPCDLNRGFATLGVAMGTGILSPTQATVAFKDWKTPQHEDFSDRNLWSLYNCATEGLKKGAVAATIDRHANAHGFFMEMSKLPKKIAVDASSFAEETTLSPGN